MSVQEFAQWIVPSPALAVWRVAKGLDFSPLEWRIYDKQLERGELAIKLWRPRVWDASGPEAAALGAMGSEYKATVGWIKVTDLGGGSCYLHGLAASADDWEQVRAGWDALMKALFGGPPKDWTLRAPWWCTKNVEVDRETVDQNVEPVFKYRAEIFERATLQRSMLEDGRVQYDMFKQLLPPPPPDYESDESAPGVPGGAMVRLQLIRIGAHRTRIDAWAKGVKRELNDSWLPNLLERFVQYLHHMAGVADTPAGGVPMPAGVDGDGPPAKPSARGVPGPKPKSKGERAAAWREWEAVKANGELTFAGWSEQRFGTHPGGMLVVPKSTFYSWKPKERGS